ncbi:uncharacterized protein LOC108324377 isoform X1 [Vigna angularis]|uniref:uncharacterized protein LOC108324377 isoform X1 n=1 Tax=Phaseolus angularis TaxID=3914 RepID=UPI0022B3508F|nr:uncharacterized protein LOC108324377 isoform X1 [Vigna angularis]
MIMCMMNLLGTIIAAVWAIIMIQIPGFIALQHQDNGTDSWSPVPIHGRYRFTAAAAPTFGPRVYIIHANPDPSLRNFSIAHKLQMMSKDYAWLLSHTHDEKGNIVNVG